MFKYLCIRFYMNVCMLRPNCANDLCVLVQSTFHYSFMFYLLPCFIGLVLSCGKLNVSYELLIEIQFNGNNGKINTTIPNTKKGYNY